MSEHPDHLSMEVLLGRLADLEEQHSHLEAELKTWRARPSVTKPRSARHGFAWGKLPSKWLPIMVLALLLPLVLASGVAASSPQTTTVYYACVNNTTGAIQIVSSTTTCPTGTH